MKNQQVGFITPLLIIIASIFIIGASGYLYFNNLNHQKSLESFSTKNKTGDTLIVPTIVGNISLDSKSPSGNIVRGTKNIQLLKFNIKALSDINVHDVSVYFASLFGGKYITNVKLVDDSGVIIDTSTGPFPTPPTPPLKNAVLLFDGSGSMFMKANSTKTFSVYADIDPSTPTSILTLGVAGISIINPGTNGESTTTIISGIPLSGNTLNIVTSNASVINILSPTAQDFNLGDSIPVTWTSSLSTSLRLDVYLDSCDTGSCVHVFTIAKNIPNSGKYDWKNQVDINGNAVSSGKYSLTLIDSNKPSTNVGFSEQFTILGLPTVTQIIPASAPTSTPVLTITPTSLNFTSQQNKLPSPTYQRLYLKSNVGVSYKLSLSVQDSNNWLYIDSLCYQQECYGKFDGSDMEVYATPGSLSIGTHKGLITISGDFTGSPINIPVTIEITN